MPERSYEQIERYEANVRTARDKIEKAAAEEKAERESHPLTPFALDEFVAQTDEETPWRIEGLCKVGGNTTITARNKVGKSTLMMNLLHSLSDGVPFLGSIPVKKPDGNICMWNMELSASMQRDWCRKIGIKQGGRVFIENLRGRRQPLYSRYTQDIVVEYLKRLEIECWIIDPAAKLLGGWPGSGNPENDNSVVTDLTDILDEIKERAGVSDLWLPVHTGRVSDKTSRGAIRWDDWPDSLLVLYIDTTLVEGEDTRVLKTRGRDVQEFARPLIWGGEETKRYTIVGDIDEMRSLGAARSVVRVLMNGPLSTAQLKAKLSGVPTDGKSAALDLAVKRGWVNPGPQVCLNMGHPEVTDMLFDFGGQ